MSALPLIMVVGNDALALRVCEELCATAGHRVALLWNHNDELAMRVERMGATFLGFPPNEFETLRISEISNASSIMALAEDDRLNLQVALKARELNPTIRVVLRQFNRALGRKIEQNLSDCSVLSLSAHSAATFAATAIDGSVFYGLQMPDVDGPLVAFARRKATEFGADAISLGDFERRHRVRVVGYAGIDHFIPAIIPRPDDEMIVFGRIEILEVLGGRHQERKQERRRRRSSARELFANAIQSFRRSDPIARAIVFIALAFFVANWVYFSYTFKKYDPVTVAYFVITTMTSTGYGDITPLENGALAKVVAGFAMIAGVALTGIVIAFATSALTRAQWIATQGVRRIRDRDHIIVCGSGQVGTRVVEFLIGLKKKVVVIDKTPDPTAIERASSRRFALLTGDATREEVLAMCNLQYAHSLIALTDNDTANLEVALGARARNPEVPVVMRVQDHTFARQIARQFSLDRTFSAAELAAPAFAGLSRFPGTRGRITYGDEDYTVGERLQGETPQPPPARHCIPLCVVRNGELVMIDEFGQMEPFDRLLFLVPLSQFRARPKEEATFEMESTAVG